MTIVLLGVFITVPSNFLFLSFCLAIFTLAFGVTVLVGSRKKNKTMREIGLGMVYGGVVSVVLLAAYLALLCFSLPGIK